MRCARERVMQKPIEKWQSCFVCDLFFFLPILLQSINYVLLLLHTPYTFSFCCCCISLCNSFMLKSISKHWMINTHKNVIYSEIKTKWINSCEKRFMSRHSHKLFPSLVVFFIFKYFCRWIGRFFVLFIVGVSPFNFYLFFIRH